MNLKQILEQKLKSQILVEVKKPMNLPQKEILDREEKEEYTSIETPSPELYSICIDFLIKRTYTSILDTRDFINFLLKPYSYTINRFEGLDHDQLTEIFNLFMLHFPPRNSYHLHALYLTLWEIELKVPAIYYDLITASIKKWGLDKNSSMP